MHLTQFKRNPQSWFEWKHDASYTQVQNKEPECLTVLTVNTPGNSATSKETTLLELVFMWWIKLSDANGLQCEKKWLTSALLQTVTPSECVCEHQQRMSECENVAWAKCAHAVCIVAMCVNVLVHATVCELPVNNPNKSGNMLVPIVCVVVFLSYTHIVLLMTHTSTGELYWRVNFQPCWGRRCWEEFEM